MLANRMIITPYDGKMKEIIVYVDADAGNTSVVTNVNDITGGASALNLPQETSTTFPIGRSFEAGDRIGIALTFTDAPQYVNITSVWEYDTNT